MRQLFLIGALLLGFVGASAKAPAVSETVSVDGRVYVDLGLPSGTKWATCNVGTTKPTESGYYFAWGETKPKEDYSWRTYKWSKGSDDSMTKY